MARILIESDRGAATLSERLISSNLADDDYAEKLVARMRWALTDAEGADTTASPEGG